VVDLSAVLKSRADRVVMTPANERQTMRANDPGLLELNEQGIYEIRPAVTSGGRPDRIAVNLDPAESDLTPLDPQELVAAVTGKATPTTPQPSTPAGITPVDTKEAERRQAIWWYLLLAGLLLLAAETVISNRLCR